MRRGRGIRKWSVRAVGTAGVLLLALMGAAPLQGQTADEAAVERVVRDLFDHMRRGDAESMRALFHPDARLVTTGVRDGEPVVRQVPIEDWLRGVATSERELDERLYDLEVRVAQGLGMVWTGYSLFVDGVFSHCGVDLFDMVRTAEGWRILAVADTRMQEGCRTS